MPKFLLKLKVVSPVPSLYEHSILVITYLKDIWESNFQRTVLY
jgi:hypothetical protein